MILELTDEQTAALRDLLDRALGDLTMEISHTDNPKFRESLRDHRDSLRAVQVALAGQDVTT